MAYTNNLTTIYKSYWPSILKLISLINLMGYFYWSMYVKVNASGFDRPKSRRKDHYYPYQIQYSPFQDIMTFSAEGRHITLSGFESSRVFFLAPHNSPAAIPYIQVQLLWEKKSFSEFVWVILLTGRVSGRQYIPLTKRCLQPTWWVARHPSWLSGIASDFLLLWLKP